MPQVIRFFPRQGIAGGTSTLYSEVYEVLDASQIVAELRLYAYSGTGAVSGFIEDSMSPTLAPDTAWRSLTSGGLSSVSGKVISGSSIQRFVRGKVTVDGTVSGAIVSFEGVSRESS